MEESKALGIVSTLAGGIDPTTGEVFAADSPYQAPEVIRALYEVLRIAENRVTVVRKRRLDIPVNAGKTWSSEEDQELLKHFDAGLPLRQIAELHQRSQAGIDARLEKLGRLTPQPGQDPRRFYAASARSRRAAPTPDRPGPAQPTPMPHVPEQHGQAEEGQALTEPASDLQARV